MAEPLRPASTKTFTRENWIFLTTVSSIAAPTVAEVTAVTGIDITNIAFANGTARPTATTNRVTAERRIGDGQQFERIGLTNHTGGDMLYVFADQAAALADGKKWYEKIPEGTSGFLVNRRGVAKATAPAAGQFVHVYPVEFGLSTPASAGEGESAEAAMTVGFAITSAPAINVAIAA